MPLTTTAEMLARAQKEGFAVGAFNIENMEMAQAVVAAAQELRAPVILQTTPSTITYASPKLYAANVKVLAETADVPVAIHLDHGSSVELAKQALEAGYTSIMIDGSKLPLEENIAVTRAVSELCRAEGVPVEGELGQVGGKEDDTECENAGYTNPAEALRFELETGLSSMAVGVGTAHGIYAAVPVLNTTLIYELKTMLRVPMVLHGASGLSDESIRDCIHKGICKVNFATELRIAFSNGIKEYLVKNPEAFDPKKYGAAARDCVKQLVMNRIRVCGCDGKY